MVQNIENIGNDGKEKVGSSNQIEEGKIDAEETIGPLTETNMDGGEEKDISSNQEAGDNGNTEVSIESGEESIFPQRLVDNSEIGDSQTATAEALSSHDEVVETSEDICDLICLFKSKNRGLVGSQRLDFI